MALSNSLKTQFAKVMSASDVDTQTKKTRTGTAVEYAGRIYVQLDGSDQLTPLSDRIAGVKDGDRVTIEIENHSASLTGNLSDPSAGSTTVDGIKNQVEQFNVIIANKADIDQLNAAQAKIDELEANDVTITGKLDAVEANITDLQAENVEITGKLDAAVAEIEDLDATYATIDFANIGDAAIENFFSKSGMIKDLVVSSGTVTGELVGVTIKGDLIEGGTVVADKLVILGDDGLYYKLNTNGETITSEQTEYNSLSGTIITAKSITAEKIAVDDLVAFGATIGGFHITDSSLYSGVKADINNTTPGVYMDDESQFALGDLNNYLRFFKDTDGTYKLEISAQSVKISTSDKTIEDSLDDMQNQIDGMDSTVTTIQVDVDNITSSVTDLEGNYTQLTQTVNGFEATINQANMSSSLNIVLESGPQYDYNKPSSSASVVHRYDLSEQGKSRITVGEDVCLSCEAKVNSGTETARLYIVNSDGNSILSESDAFTLTTSWQQFYFNTTFKASGGAYFQLTASSTSTGSGKTYSIRHAKATIGAVAIEAPSWTAAPEDIMDAQSAANSALSTANAASGDLANYVIDGTPVGSGSLSGWQVVGGAYQRTFPGGENHVDFSSQSARRSWGVGQALVFSAEFRVVSGTFSSSDRINIYEGGGSWNSFVIYPAQAAGGGWVQLSATLNGSGVTTTAMRNYGFSSYVTSSGAKVLQMRNVQILDGNAAKTATNYLKFDSSGLCVGNMTGTLGYNALITSSQYQIRNGSTVLSSFGASTVNLGQNSPSAKINLCGSNGRIQAANGVLSVDGNGVALYLGNANSVTEIYGNSYVSIYNYEGSPHNVRVTTSGVLIDGHPAAYTYTSGSWHIMRSANMAVVERYYRCTQNATIDQAWGGVYYSREVLTLPNFPLTFSDLPAVFIDYLGADPGTNGDAYVCINQGGGRTTTNPGGFRLQRGTTRTIGHPQVRIIAVGPI